MKLLIWNVNGIRAISKKQVLPKQTFHDFIKSYDIIVLNETKIDCKKIEASSDLLPNGYNAYHSCSSVKKGYSGVTILSKSLPINRIEPDFKDVEGRIVILEYDKFILVGVYVPNAGQADVSTKMPKRLQYRTKNWDVKFRSLITQLERKKFVIIAGDLNVANQEIDVHESGRNKRQAGYTVAERDGFAQLLQDTTMVDLWRRMHPNKVQYTYFDYRTRARNRNAGWRIDYVLVSKNIYNEFKSCNILENVVGSDHIPIEITFKLL